MHTQHLGGEQGQADEAPVLGEQRGAGVMYLVSYVREGNHGDESDRRKGQTVSGPSILGGR